MKRIKQQIWRDNPENILLEFLKNQMCITIMDMLGRIIYTNDQFCELVESSQDQVIGEVNTLLRTERHFNPIYKDLWATINRGQIWKGVLSDLTKSGKLFWLETTIIPVTDSDGTIDKFMAIYMDVTQKAKKDLMIVNREIALRGFKDHIPNVVLSINEFGEILSINQGIDNLSVEEIIGSSLYNYINPIFHDMVRDIVNTVFKEGKPNQYETMDYNAEGIQTFYISQIGPVIKNNGSVISATISTQVVREIKGIKQDLIENEAKYRTIFQSMKVGIIVVTNNKGKITEWNKGAERAFGYSEREIIGKPLTKLISTKQQETGLNEILNAVKNLEDINSTDTIEMNGLKKNGAEFPVEFALSSWKSRNKNYYCAMMLDISKRKNLENKLISKTKELELFLYRSAHDLKAPLTSAEGLVNLIKQENVNTNVLNLTAMIDATLDRGKLVLDDLLLASVISGKGKETFRIDFKGMVSNILETFSGLEKFESIKFKIDIPDSIEFYASIELMHSMLQNLIQNAIKYSRPKTAKHKPFVAIKIVKIKHGIKLTVCDNGQGISKNNIPKIFDLYFRESNEGVPGSGLGLYIVKNIVEDLNGHIKVNVTATKGTCFEVKLPNFNLN